MAKIETIIFDWSGVISNDWKATVATANDILELRGRRRLSEKRFRELYELPWINFYRKQGIKATVKGDYALWEKMLPAHYNLIKLFPKAGKVLASLKKSGRKMIVFSSRNQKSLNEEIAKERLGKFFDAVYGHIPDKRKRIEELIANHEIEREKTIYVGDMCHDIETARLAGIKSVAVLSGYDTKKKLQEKKPDYTIKSIANLPALIEKIEKKETVKTKRIGGKRAHVVVVALIEIRKKLVMLSRAYPIKCTSLIIGHAIKGEKELQTLEREVLEETGGKILKKKFLGNRVFDYGWKCTRGSRLHEWRIYSVHIDKLRKREIDEGKLLLVPFGKIARQKGISQMVKSTLKEFGYISEVV